jgi:hypothetical protein
MALEQAMAGLQEVMKRAMRLGELMSRPVGGIYGSWTKNRTNS